MPAFYEDDEICDDANVDDADDDIDDADDDVDDADDEGEGPTDVDDCPHIPTAKETRTNSSL